MTKSTKRTSRPITEGEAPAVKRKLPVGLLIVGGGAIVVLLLVIVLVIANRPTPVSAEVYEGLPSTWVERRSLGNPDAPVVIQAWEDFRCPACAAWAQQIKPRLLNNYISPDGEIAGGMVRLEFHHFPLTSHGETAINAAQASECAADQGMFWPYHDRLFTVTNEGPAGFTIDRLTNYAGELGLDRNQFSQCLLSQKYFNDVQRSVGQAISMGLDATPSVLINGQRLPQPFDYQALTSEIQRLVTAAGR
jgi:protein-disulfide isomerase